MKRACSILIVIIFLFGITSLSGCSHTVNKTPVVSNPQEIYKVAVTGGTPPFGCINKSGNYEGFERDLMDAIAKEEGFKVTYQVTKRASRIPALNGKEQDVIMAVMTITEDRKKQVDFSDPYFEATLNIIVPADSKIKSLEDLKGKTVACAMATTSDIAVSEFLGKDYEGIKRFKETTPTFMELRNRRVDAAVADCGIVTQYLKNNPEAKFKIIKDDRFPKEYYGMAVRKGDIDTLKKINRGLKKIRENGKYEEIYQKWFANK